MYVNMNSGAVQAGLMPFRNALINGDMRINQRGTSTNLASLTTVATGSWVTDRWNVLRGGYAAGAVIGQGTSLTNSDLPFSDAGIKTFGRIGRLSGNTATNDIALNYNMESQDCYQYVGKTVTLSFYYRTGTNFSGSALIAQIITGTGTDQALRNGYTGLIAQTITNIVSSTWRRVSFTVTLSSLLNQIGLGIQYTPVGTAGTNDYFDITGIQLELGSVPTSFEVRPFPVELQLCLRYCESSFQFNIAPANQVSQYVEYSGIAFSTGWLNAQILFKVQKRTTPDIITLYRPSPVVSGTWAYAISGTGFIAWTPNIPVKNEIGFILEVTSGASTTTGYAYRTAGNWLVSSEL
jgi:hypothetical protein